MIRIWISNVWFHFNVWLCYVGPRYCKYDNRHMKKLVSRLLMIQFWIIGKPFVKIRTNSQYMSYSITEEQLDLWKKICVWILRYWVYPGFDKKRAEKEVSWLFLDTLPLKKGAD